MRNLIKFLGFPALWFLSHIFLKTGYSSPAESERILENNYRLQQCHISRVPGASCCSGHGITADQSN